MDVSLSDKYNTKYKCYKHLEKVRWNNNPVCPHCNNDGITKRKRPFYYHCNKCNRDFTVLVGTFMEASKLPLPKWFLLIARMLNTRKQVSAKQLQRNLGVTYKSAWYNAMCVRCAMVEQSNMNLLEAIVGHKKQKGRQIETDKGITTNNMLLLLNSIVKGIPLHTEIVFYNDFDDISHPLIIEHTQHFKITKQGVGGEYCIMGKKYLPFYLIEFAYKYNAFNLLKTNQCKR